MSPLCRVLPTTPIHDSAAAARRRGLARVGILTLVVAVLLVYANTFSVPFLLDDTKSILENPSIRHLWPLGDALNPPADSGFGGRPLANLSLALNWAIGESRVGSYHGFNLAIHLLAGLVLFTTSRRLVRLRAAAGSGAPDQATPIAGLTAALWLLHPPCCRQRLCRRPAVSHCPPYSLSRRLAIASQPPPCLARVSRLHPLPAERPPQAARPSHRASRVL